MQRRMAIAQLGVGLGMGLAGAAWRPAPAQAAERFFTTSDGVRLHVIDQGPAAARRPHTLVLVPGWTMPAWIFQNQIAAFSPTYRVLALDPRGQGTSEVAPGGYDQARRGRDIAELIAGLGPERVVLLGWSLGVLDSLAYLHEFGDSRLAGLVLVDNSIGEEPAPTPAPPSRRQPPPRDRAEAMRRFVTGMFARPQPRAYLDRLTRASLVTPEWAARALLEYPVPRSYWREAVYSTTRPVLYVVRPRWAGQAANLAARHPAAETVVMQGVGHAMFVDDPGRFNATLASFLRRRVWP